MDMRESLDFGETRVDGGVDEGALGLDARAVLRLELLPERLLGHCAQVRFGNDCEEVGCQ